MAKFLTMLVQAFTARLMLGRRASSGLGDPANASGAVVDVNYGA